jgi:hypothetical protein
MRLLYRVACISGILLFSSGRTARAAEDFSSQVSSLQSQISQVSIGQIAAKRELEEKVNALASLAKTLDDRAQTIPNKEASISSAQAEAQSAKADADRLEATVEQSRSEVQADAQALIQDAKNFDAQCSEQVHVFKLPAEQAAYDACVQRKQALLARQAPIESRAQQVKDMAENYDKVRAEALSKEVAAKNAANEVERLKREQEADRARFQSDFNFASKAYNQLVAIANSTKNLPGEIPGPNAKPGREFDQGASDKGGTSQSGAVRTTIGGPQTAAGAPVSKPGGGGVLEISRGGKGGTVDARGIAGTQLPASDPLIVKQQAANEALRKIEQDKNANPAQLKQAVDEKTKSDSQVVWKRYQESLKKGTVDTTVNASELSK